MSTRAATYILVRNRTCLCQNDTQWLPEWPWASRRIRCRRPRQRGKCGWYKRLFKPRNTPNTRKGKQLSGLKGLPVAGIGPMHFWFRVVRVFRGSICCSSQAESKQTEAPAKFAKEIVDRANQEPTVYSGGRILTPEPHPRAIPSPHDGEVGRGSGPVSLPGGFSTGCYAWARSAFCFSPSRQTRTI